MEWWKINLSFVAWGVKRILNAKQKHVNSYRQNENLRTRQLDDNKNSQTVDSVSLGQTD